MSLEFRQGVTESLVDMVIYSAKFMEDFKNIIPDREEAKRRLNNMEWCVGAYEREECVAAMWGDNNLNIISRPEWRGKFMTRRMLREFFRFFFSKYKVAKAQTKDYYDLWKRLGFNGTKEEMEVTWGELRIS